MDKVVFTTEEWARIKNWTGESDQEQLLRDGPEGVTPEDALVILIEIVTEGGINDKSMLPIVRKLGQLISQFYL